MGDAGCRQSVRRYDQEGLTMTTITIENVKMSIGAAGNVEMVGAHPRADVARVRAGLSRDELLAECLDGCEDEPQTAADWREYVDAVMAAADEPADIEVTHVARSTTVSPDEYPGAVDADVTVDGLEGEVTLVRNHEGRLDMWGGLENWASENLHVLDRGTLTEIVAAVREAAAQAQS